MLTICYIVLVVTAAVYDVATLKIPNPISVGLVGLFLLLGLVAPWQFAWLDHLAAGVALFGAGLVLFNFRLLGGGDVKLLTTGSPWAGRSAVSAMLVTTAIVGGLLGVSLLLVRPIASPW